MASLRFDHVTKIYPNDARAVDAFSLQVDDGQFVTIIGPSGSGKSTLLRMVAGLEAVTLGTITIGARVVNDLAPKDRDVAMVFQNYALYPHMTAYDNMAFGLKMRGFKRPAIDERVRWASLILGLDGLLARKPAALSGGERQRVAVGRAIVRQPQVFLFDEPLSNLDAKLRLDIRAEIKRLHDRLKTTTLYVTHDFDEARTLGDVVIELHAGRMRPLT